MRSLLEIRGAREHNLRGLDLDLPRDGLIGIAGVSGSGKSSLAIDTLFREGQRRYLQTLSARARRFAADIDRAEVDRLEGLRPAIAVDQRARAFGRRSSVASLTEIHDLLAALFARFGVPHCPRCALALAPQSAERIAERICAEAAGRRALVLAPLSLVRRTELGALVEQLRSLGLARLRMNGEVARLDGELPLPDRGVPRIEAVVDRVVPDPSKRARIHEAVTQALELSRGFVGLAVEGGAEHLYATARACPSCRVDLPLLEPALFSFRGPRGACRVCRGCGEEDGSRAPCAACGGTRLRPEARAVRWQGRRFDDLLLLPVERAAALWRELALDERELAFGEAAFRGIGERLALLERIGLGHLPLARAGRALSGGEAQRVRLVAQLGAHLRDVLYVLDEPSTGLHPSEVERVVAALRELRDRGNTVLVVEHDPRVLRALDWLVELGPGAGAAGGAVIASGPPRELAERAETPTARALLGAFPEAGPPRRFDVAQAPRLVLRGARGGALRIDELALPLGALVAISGVSGAGKSTLCLRTLVPAVARALGAHEARPLPFDELLGVEALARVLALDAAPSARGARSDVATLCGLAPLLRERLAETPEARARGYGPQRFSAQVAEGRGGGRCEACRGLGRRALRLARGAELPSSCDVCGGTRFSPATREIRFGGLDIAGWLALRVDEAAERLRDQPAARRALDALRRLGLGYLSLDQRARELSGGEHQRVRLAIELARPTPGRTLYVLDEPSRGLHPADVGGLLDVLFELVARGDSAVVIEHDEQVLRRAEWIIELGPGPAEHGGHVIASGTPAELAARATGATGRILAERPKWELDPAPVAPRATELAVRGARLHNLQGLDARFPLGRLSVVTGPSGSGKSTLLLEVVHAEGRRRFLESLGAGARKRLGTLARAPHDGIDGLGPTLAVDAADAALEAGRDVADLAEVARDLGRYFARVATPHCPEHGLPLGPLEPSALAREVAERWRGTKGYLCVPWPRTGTLEAERELLVSQGFLRALVDGRELRLDEREFAPREGARIELVLDRVSFEERALPRLVEAIEAASRTRGRRLAFVQRDEADGDGAGRIEVDLAGGCPRCGATPPAEWSARRLRAEARWARSLRLTRDEGESAASLADWLAWPFAELASEVGRERVRARRLGGERAAAAERVLPRLAAVLATLVRLGLGHLDASRDAGSLSSGELRRLRLAAALAGGLDGFCAVLDEPSAGLHTRDLDALYHVLAEWRDAGNTLLVVEHAEELIERADHVLELGPGAGVDGGRCIVSGTPELIAASASATGRALRGELFARAAARAERRERLRLEGARTRHLQGVALEVRAGSITALSGVSGSGKSSLLLGTLVPAFESARGLPHAAPERAALARWDALDGADHFAGCCVVDERPLARTRRATVAAALGVWDRLRELWSRVPEARARGYSARTFSFGGSRRSGACSVCQGLGERRLDRGFLAELWAPCEECHGARFRAEVLEVRWRGRSIADVLELELRAAAEFFAEQPSFARALAPALEIGLAHLRLGQALHALSGGELRRLKLAPALAARADGAPLLIALDEPSQGLHPIDVATLASSLEALAARGHAVVLIEHDALLLWRAHEVVDLGPGGGTNGGRVLFRGTPEALAEQREEARGGATAEALRRALARAEGRRAGGANGKSRAGGRGAAAGSRRTQRRR